MIPFGENWQEVDSSTFFKFIEDNKGLTEIRTIMDYCYIDNDGIEQARIGHGLVRSHYYIKTEKNYEALDFISNYISKRQS